MLPITKITEAHIKKNIQKNYASDLEDFLMLFGEDHTCLPSITQKFTTELENFEVRNDDVIVASFPKAGTTWTQEMVWSIKNRANLEGASLNLYQRFPMLEGCALPSLHTTGEPFILNSLEYLGQIKGQRLIKTHLPFSLLPKDIQRQRKSPKIIYVVRNPKDVFISYYHHTRIIDGFKGDLEDFSELFLSDNVVFAPFWKHVVGFYNRKDLPNVLILKYEDMKDNLKSAIVRVSQFLEEKPLTDDELTLLDRRLDFNFMKHNPSVNHQCFSDEVKRKNRQLEGGFMRSGSVGSYNREMTNEMVQQFDKWIKENITDTELYEQYWFGV